jgi:hypothetical protein
MRDVDFTYAAYEELLDTCLDGRFDCFTVREYIQRLESTSHSLPDRFLILCHDIDRKPRNALAIARIEAEYEVQSTYYTRTIEKTFQPDIVERIDSLGHEVGYHYEDVDRTGGDLNAASQSFAENLSMLRQHVTVDTVCPHRNPLTAHDNRALWRNITFEANDLLGDAIHSIDADVAYFSDAGRTWRHEDHTVPEHATDIEAHTTFELMDLLATERIERACLHSHPNRWAGSYPELIFEHAKDTAANMVKHGLSVVT